MTILMFSEDPTIAARNSRASARMRAYASLFDALYVIVPAALPEKPWQEGNLFVYPAYHKNLFLRKMRFYAIAKTLARKIHFDVITVQGPDEIGLLGFFISRKFHIPLQVQVHTDVLSLWYRRVSWHERVRYYFAKLILPRADCIRVVSARVARSLTHELGIPSARIAVLPISSDFLPFLSAIKNSSIEEQLRKYSFRMIAAGRFMEKEKNFSMLIRMMPELLKIVPDAVLYLVGEGPDRAVYQKIILHLHLENSVFLESWHDNLYSLYASFDLFLLSSNYEGWGMAVIEAMAAGLSVVMTDVGLAGEVVQHGENGIVVPVGDAKAFLDAVLDLHRNQETRVWIAKNAQETARELNTKRQNYVQKYQESFFLCRRKNGV